MKSNKTKLIIGVIIVLILGIITWAICFNMGSTHDSADTNDSTQEDVLAITDDDEDSTEDAIADDEEKTDAEENEDILDDTSADADDTEADADDTDTDVTEVASSSITNTSKISPSVCGQLSVEGTNIVDEQGNVVQLYGISTHGLQWFPDYVNEDCFSTLSSFYGCNVVRLAMYTAESGYCVSSVSNSLKQLVIDGVEYATANDMYVIIDWHILSDGNPLTYQDQAIAFFTEMSALYADYNNVIYEICNEPNGCSWSDVKSYAEAVIPAIRANDDDAIILVGTPNWSQYVNEAAADPITGYDNIMYTLHFYAATHTDWLRNILQEAHDAGLPIFVSEFGICDASGSGSIDESQANTWIELLDSLNISFVAWNLSNKNETSALLSTSCNKVSGFTYDDLSDSGKWLYNTIWAHLQ